MRATYLNFRNPKEETPDAYHTTLSNDGRPLNIFEVNLQSESQRGTFALNNRFTNGSIYANVCSSPRGVGPGAYKDD